MAEKPAGQPRSSKASRDQAGLYNCDRKELYFGKSRALSCLWTPNNGTAKKKGGRALITAIDHDTIRYEGVQISVESVSALSGDKVLSAVPRKLICRITLCHDTSARYPFLQFSFGFIFILLGIVGMTAAFLIDTENNVALLPERQFIIPVLPIILWGVIGAGIWLMSGIFRTEYHLLLETKDKKLKLFFKKSADIHEIHQFIRRARLEFGYVIDAAIIEESPASS